MSADPNMMSQMLMQRLMQPAPTPGTGGMQGSTSPQNAAAQLVQKAMLVRALQGGSTPQQMMQQHQATAGVPGTSTMINPAMAQNPQVQAMQQGMQQPMQMPPIDPSLMPTPGYS